MTCAEAIKQIVNQRGIISFPDLLSRIKELSNWADDTTAQHVVGPTVNLYPASIHWPQFENKRFLFQHEDGRYEIYDPANHYLRGSVD